MDFGSIFMEINGSKVDFQSSLGIKRTWINVKKTRYGKYPSFFAITIKARHEILDKKEKKDKVKVKI